MFVRWVVQIKKKSRINRTLQMLDKSNGSKAQTSAHQWRIFNSVHATRLFFGQRDTCLLEPADIKKELCRAEAERRM